MDNARQLAETKARRLARRMVRREQRRVWWEANKDRINVLRRSLGIDFVISTASDIEQFLRSMNFDHVADRVQPTYRIQPRHFKYFEVVFCSKDVIDFVYERDNEGYNEYSFVPTSVSHFEEVFNRVYQ